MAYFVNELFYSIQGEGAQSGRPAVFCRFAGCNLWDGMQASRHIALCRFCDTDFADVRMRFESARPLVRAIRSMAPKGPMFVVLTGGEPALQVDEELIGRLQDADATVAIETNGTVLLDKGIDWVCVSPKASGRLLVTSGDELKVVYPQESLDMDQMSSLDFKHFFIQPMDGQNVEKNTSDAIRFCMENPKWRLSTQAHKRWGIK